MNFIRKSLLEQHYIYVDRKAPFSEPGAIGEAMASGFGAIYNFFTSKGITPVSAPSSIYMEMPSGDTMHFRAGIFVTADDAKKAEGDVKSATMSAGEVVTGTHVGPYASLNQSHKALWDYFEEHGLEKAMPVWEIYIDDPDNTPEADLRTEVYRSIGS